MSVSINNLTVYNTSYLQHILLTTPPLQHPLTTPPYNTPLQHPLTTPPYNTPLQHPLKTPPYNTPLQHPLTTLPYNTPLATPPLQHPLITPPLQYQPLSQIPRFNIPHSYNTPISTSPYHTPPYKMSPPPSQYNTFIFKKIQYNKYNVNTTCIVVWSQ